MEFKHFFNFVDSKKVREPLEKERDDGELCDIFREGVELKSELGTRLKNKMVQGVAFFNKYNEVRLAHTFESFDISMRYALYEIIYLLHVNHPKFKTWSFETFYPNRSDSSRTKTIETDIYVNGAPSGVKSIFELSSIFKTDFERYIKDSFDDQIFAATNENEQPIEGIFSTGSIGTIGHKNISSDLDLEIHFNLEPFFHDVTNWNDALLQEFIKKEHSALIARYYQKKGIESDSDISDQQKTKIGTFFENTIKKKYPLLHSHFISKQKNIYREILEKKDKRLQHQLIQEIMVLADKNSFVKPPSTIRKEENLLRERIKKIERYIRLKFPEAEIHLFPLSQTELREGKFGSTIDSKESSGEAYELILNYETLMPGVYFIPVVPSHFIIPTDINNDEKRFNRTTDLLKFELLDFYKGLSSQLTSHGRVPDLDKQYVAKHHTSVYWEAFKASSGNLPKATLNLLRYEMLLEDNVGKTIIQLIKKPHLLDYLIPEYDEDLERVSQKKKYFTIHNLISFEQDNPDLCFDPWWLRFKALKIAFGVPEAMDGISESEIHKISEVIDYAFALHIRLSDVFVKPGEKNTSNGYREKILKQFLKRAFPEGSENRVKLYATFVGDIRTVNEFEQNLKTIFLRSISRIHEKIKQMDISVDSEMTSEYKIWHHHYKTIFQPKENVVQKSILSHLKVPRGRLQIGFEKEKGWFFKSLNKETIVGKRFQFSILNLLPDEAVLIDQTKFLYGLVYCVVNGYYGIFNKGKLNETRTAVEYDRQYTNLGSKYDNLQAFIRPDQIEKIMEQINQLFPHLEVSYLDCVNKERKINELMIFINLLKYGQLSFLYRDNLNVLRVDQYDLPGFVQRAETYISSYKKMFQSKILHVTLLDFFNTKKIDPREINMNVWVNSNSVETTHSAVKYEQKEKDLSRQLHDVILSVYSQRKMLLKNKTPVV